MSGKAQIASATSWIQFKPQDIKQLGQGAHCQTFFSAQNPADITRGEPASMIDLLLGEAQFGNTNAKSVQQPGNVVDRRLRCAHDNPKLGRGVLSKFPLGSQNAAGITIAMPTVSKRCTLEANSRSLRNCKRLNWHRRMMQITDSGRE